MQIPTYREIQGLAAQEAKPSVSVYFSRGDGRDKSEGLIQLKNAVTTVEKELSARGVPYADAARIVEHLRKLDESQASWNQPRHGVATFASPNAFRPYTFRAAFAPMAVAGAVFHLRPLLRAWIARHEYCILAASRASIRLLHVNHGEVTAVQLPTLVSEGAADFARPEQEQRRSRIQARTIPSGVGASSGSVRPALFHAHEDRERPESEWTLQYLRDVDREVSGRLRALRVPLIFAGDVSTFALYRKANTSPHLLLEFLRGNPDGATPDDLMESARPVMARHGAEQQERIIERVSEMVAHGQGTTDLARTIHAAMDGRVEHLLVAENLLQWGRFDPDTRNVQLLPDRAADSEDVVNLAVVHVVRHGGRVLEVAPDCVPGGGCVAASFRY